MHTGKQKQMNVSYQVSLVNRHIRRFTGKYNELNTKTGECFSNRFRRLAKSLATLKFSETAIKGFKTGAYLIS